MSEELELRADLAPGALSAADDPVEQFRALPRTPSFGAGPAPSTQQQHSIRQAQGAARPAIFGSRKEAAGGESTRLPTSATCSFLAERGSRRLSLGVSLRGPSSQWKSSLTVAALGRAPSRSA